MRLALKRRNSATVLDNLYQSGCLRARIVRTERRQPTEIVLLNTAGGLTGGDRLSASIEWGPGTQATMTTQACEKIYRAAGGEARVENILDVGKRAVAEWLPQETILFDGAALWRDIRVQLESDAVFTGLESAVLGRTAMGETIESARFKDRWRIWRAGALIYADVFELKGDVPALLSKAAVTQGRIAFANLLHVAPAAETMLDAVRALLAAGDCMAGASAWNGLLAVRFVAEGSAQLRAALLRVLDLLRQAPMPRVWQT